jgi:hypothetical protein
LKRGVKEESEMKYKVVNVLNFFICLWIFILTMAALYSTSNNLLFFYVITFLSSVSFFLIIKSGGGFNLGKAFIKFIIIFIFLSVSNELIISYFENESLNYKLIVFWIAALPVILNFDKFWVAALKK